MFYKIDSDGSLSSNENNVLNVTPQFTGGKKHSEERATLFAVRVKLHCYVVVAH